MTAKSVMPRAYCVRRRKDMKFNNDRREALAGLGVALVASGLAQGGTANAAAETSLEASGSKNLHDLTRSLAGMPRRRDFKTVPMILDHSDQWDAAPLAAVFAYRGGPKRPGTTPISPGPGSTACAIP
jgi:hypothetical protein